MAPTMETLLARAQEGDAAAMYGLGDCYCYGISVAKDDATAIEWYKRAADSGHVGAMYSLGCFYKNGWGVTQDYAQAVAWYRRAADNGNAGAMFHLGDCYARGQRVVQDYGQAAEWYRRAAEKGHAVAMLNLGILYCKGQGVAQDHQQAVEWYRGAAEKGVTDAMFELGVCYDVGLGIAPDHMQAVACYRRAADKGHTNSMFSLGVHYEEGMGVAQAYKPAAAWYRRAAAKGHPCAMDKLGVCYHDGKGVAQDHQQAVEWWVRAADKGHASAMFKLAHCYEHGTGVTKDIKRAHFFYARAAAVGHRDAIEALKRLGVTPPSISTEATPSSTAEQAAGHAPPKQNVLDPSIAARRSEHKELEQDVQLDLERRVAERLRPYCATCGRDLQPGSTLLLSACLHSSCTACLEQSAALACSLCGITSTMNEDAEVRHPLVEASVSTGKRLCAECHEDAEDNVASHHCADCQSFLCKAHATTHRKSRSTKAHSLDALASENDDGHCKVHGKLADIYCATCQMVVCYVCAKASHPEATHAHHIIDGAYCAQARQRVSAAAERAETAVQARAGRALDASITLAEIHERSQALKGDIRARMNALRALMDQRCLELEGEVDAIAAEESRRIRELGEGERVANTVLATTVPLARHLADAQTPAHTLARLEPAVCARLDELVRAVPSDPVPLPAQVTFSFADAELENAIRTAGSFAVSSR